MCSSPHRHATSFLRLPESRLFVITTRRTFIASLSALVVPLPSRAQAAVRVGGSGVCHRLLVGLSTLYSAQSGAPQVAVAPPLGSTGGIRGVAGGQLDLACISRPLSGPETVQALRTVPLVRSPFVVITHPHAPLHDLRGPELVRLLSDPAATFADGTRVRPILRPRDDTDTRLMLRLHPDMAQALELCAARPGVVIAATDQDAVRAVASTPGALGVSTLGLLLSEKSLVKVLDWDGHVPLRDGHANPDYPHQKEIRFAYPAAAPEATLKFIAFVRTAPAQLLMRQWGYLPVKPEGTP